MAATRSRVSRTHAGSRAHAGRSRSTASASPRAWAWSTSSTRARSFPEPVSARASRAEIPRKTNSPNPMASHGLPPRMARHCGVRSAERLSRLGQIVARELQEALHAGLLAAELLRHAMGMPGGRGEEVVEAALRVVGQRVHARDVLLRADDAERRAALGQRPRRA